MFTWDEIIDFYAVLKRGSEGLERSKLAGCMLQILPSLRIAVEEHFENVRLALVMVAVELRIPGTSQAVVIQCVGECQFSLSLKNNWYEVLAETEADLSNVVEQTLQYLEMTRQEDQTNS